MMANFKKFFLIIMFSFSNLLIAQRANINLVSDIGNYKKDRIKIHYSIENPNLFPIYFIFDGNEFSEYGLPNFYYLDEDVADYESNRDEGIFNPRPIIVDIETKDTLQIMPTLHVTPDIVYLDKCKEKEKDFFEKKKYEVIMFQKKNFPTKNLVWNKRAKYINENLIILQPNESINFITEVNFTELLNRLDDCNFSNMGFNLDKEEYVLSIKIHNDINLALQYLNKENKEKIKKSKAKALNNDVYSNQIIISTKKL